MTLTRPAPAALTDMKPSHLLLDRTWAIEFPTSITQAP